MKNLLLTLTLSLAALPVLSTHALAADDLPPARAAEPDAADDLPPPRMSTRKPRTVEAATVPDAAAETTTSLDPTDDLPPPSAKKTYVRGVKPTFKYGVDDLLLELGGLPDATEADTYSTLRTKAYVLWQPSRDWELRAGARIDGAMQRGGVADFTDLSADYTDTYVRYRSGDTRLTLGAQTIVWGRADEIPLADRVSRADLTRFVLDDLPDRRRAELAARWEQTLGDYKLDAVWLPVFNAAELPDASSVWSPINLATGEIIGIAPSPAVAALVKNAAISEDEHGSGGGAVRLTKTGGAIDYGLTLARTRQSQPYYQIGGTPFAPMLTGVHPFNNFAGADLELESNGITWRMELGYTDAIPVTLPTAVTITAPSLDWVGGIEFFPGGADTRINLQLVAQSLQTDKTVLQLTEYYGTNGSIETSFGQGRWSAGLRFFGGFNVKNLYLNPEISYSGWEPLSVYAGYHYFNGEDRTLAGFQEDHSMAVIGMRGQF
ncbi:MAG: hypothetical protein KKG40_06920 [Gammaproteobacteria bacterium]|nr:hypothetical protein [Gammaproteobacteria bacterium]